jgi:hypothetical protein
MIHLIVGCSSIVVVAHEWPCWLPVALAWKLPVTAVFPQSRFLSLFAPLTNDSIRWGTLQEWLALTQVPHDWEISMILGSGKSEFFSVVLIKLSTHVGLLLYSMDMVFTGHRLRLVRGLYSSWSRKWWLEHILQSVVVAHINFGGVMSAIHLIAYRGIANSCFRPHGDLAQMLAHTINPASINRAPAIDPPEPIEMPPPRQPIVSGDLLRGEGLFDIPRQKLEIACRSVFTPFSWVQRWLTPEEFLRVFDIPALLTSQLLDN